jgi:hypothetical protein
MKFNHYELQDLTVKDFEKLLNKKVRITLLKPKKPKGFEIKQSEFIGIVNKLGLSANSPHIPVDINVQSEEVATDFNVNIFQIKTLEII